MLDITRPHFRAFGREVVIGAPDARILSVVFSATRNQTIGEGAADARLLAHVLNNYHPLIVAAKQHQAAFTAFLTEANWGKSVLSNETIQMANEAPVRLGHALRRADLASLMTDGGCN